MAAHWGVDSLNPASTKLHVKGNPTLFDYVCDQAGRVPAFWGRYITALTFTKNGKKIKFPKLEKGEVEFIFNKSKGATRILPIYNLAWPGATSLKGGAPQGENDARKAIGAADELGIPAGVFLWCDIEPGWKTAAALRSSTHACRFRRCSATRRICGHAPRAARPTRCISIATSRHRAT